MERWGGGEAWRTNTIRRHTQTDTHTQSDATSPVVNAGVRGPLWGEDLMCGLVSEAKRSINTALLQHTHTVLPF